MISGLARAYWKDRQHNSSIPLFEEFLTARRQQNQLYDFESLNTMRVLGECYLKTNQDQKANDLYSDFLEYSLYAERQQMEIATDATHIGKNLLDRKQYGLASQFFSAALHTCLEHAERKLRIYELQTLLALSQMGQAIVTPEASADPEDLLKTAKVLLLDTYEGLEELKPTAKSRILKHRAAGALVHIYVRTKETQQALKWKKIYESLAP